MSAPVVNLSLRPLPVHTHGRPLMLIGTGTPLRHDDLDEVGAAMALRLFRSGLDNVDIAWRLECTPAAAANAIANARDEERNSILDQGACHA